MRRPPSPSRPSAPGAPIRHNSRHRQHFRRAVSGLGLGLVATLGACRPVAPAFGPTPAEAARNAGDLFGALAARFTNVERSPEFARARQRLARFALTPSAALRDTALWTGGAGDSRVLVVHGRLVGNRYRFDTRPTVPALTQPGESRRVTRLTRLGDGVYRWDTTVDLAAGEVPPAALAEAWRAWLRSAEGRATGALRADYRAAFPRTTRALGKLLSLDSLETTRLPDGSTAVRLHVRMEPDRIRADKPDFAKYLDKYFTHGRFDIALGDEQATWLRTTGRDMRYTVQLRTRDGRLLALDGSARPMPTTVGLRADLSAKVGLFTVGVKRLRGEMTTIAAPDERGWLFRFTQEPGWDFPLAVDRLIKSALRRPFMGDGSSVRVTAVRDPAGQTVLARRAQVPVQESAIVRWLGRLGATAVGDFEGAAEEQENRFWAEVFRAMADDTAALLR